MLSEAEWEVGSWRSRVQHSLVKNQRQRRRERPPLREGPPCRHWSSKSQQETAEAVPRLILQLCTRLALVPVAQAGKPVLDDLIAVLPALGQVDHLAGGDQGPDLILGHGDQAWHVWAGGARQDHTGCVTTGLQQDRCCGDRVMKSLGPRPTPGGQRPGPSPDDSPRKAMMLSEMLTRASKTLGRVGWNMYRQCRASAGSWAGEGRRLLGTGSTHPYLVLTSALSGAPHEPLGCPLQLAPLSQPHR